MHTDACYTRGGAGLTILGTPFGAKEVLDKHCMFFPDLGHPGRVHNMVCGGMELKETRCKVHSN
jgi:hypothetical protein